MAPRLLASTRVALLPSLGQSYSAHLPARRAWYDAADQERSPRGSAFTPHAVVIRRWRVRSPDPFASRRFCRKRQVGSRKGRSRKGTFGAVRHATSIRRCLLSVSLRTSVFFVRPSLWSISYFEGVKFTQIKGYFGKWVTRKAHEKGRLYVIPGVSRHNMFF